MSSINPSYLSPPNFFRIMAQKRDKRSLLSCAPPPPHPHPHPPSSGGLSPLANSVTMWKLAFLLYPYCYQTFPESNKKTPNQNQINKNTEKSSSTIYLTLAGRNPLRRRWEASSTQLSPGLSRSLSLSLSLASALWLARCTEGPSKLAPQRGTSKQAPVIFPFCP